MRTGRWAVTGMVSAPARVINGEGPSGRAVGIKVLENVMRGGRPAEALAGTLAGGKVTTGCVIPGLVKDRAQEDALLVLFTVLPPFQLSCDSHLARNYLLHRLPGHSRTLRILRIMVAVLRMSKQS